MQPEGEKHLDHLYSTYRNVYIALPHPPFGKSDHNSILLIPANKQILKQEPPVTLFIKKWSEYGICSRILPMALRSTPDQSLALSISALRTSSPQ
jgi:hypothetical protein